MLGRAPGSRPASAEEEGGSGGCSAEGGGAETRYARPWRPVKPLLMMEEVGMRSVRHFEQRRCEVVEGERKEVG